MGRKAADFLDNLDGKSSYRVVHLSDSWVELTLIHDVSLQRRAWDHSKGFEDKNLGSSPGLLGQ